MSNFESKRIYWHSRRGMLELDLLLVPFFEAHFEQLDDEDKQRYVDFLTCEDQDMFAWLMLSKPVEDPNHAKIVEMIRAHNEAVGKEKNA